MNGKNLENKKRKLYPSTMIDLSDHGGVAVDEGVFNSSSTTAKSVMKFVEKIDNNLAKEKIQMMEIKKKDSAGFSGSDKVSDQPISQKMKVLHDINSFSVGESTILTLSDNLNDFCEVKGGEQGSRSRVGTSSSSTEEHVLLENAKLLEREKDLFYLERKKRPISYDVYDNNDNDNNNNMTGGGSSNSCRQQVNAEDGGTTFESSRKGSFIFVGDTEQMNDNHEYDVINSMDSMDASSALVAGASSMTLPNLKTTNTAFHGNEDASHVLMQESNKKKRKTYDIALEKAREKSKYLREIGTTLSSSSTSSTSGGNEKVASGQEKMSSFNRSPSSSSSSSSSWKTTAAVADRKKLFLDSLKQSQIQDNLDLRNNSNTSVGVTINMTQEFFSKFLPNLHNIGVVENNNNNNNNVLQQFQSTSGSHGGIEEEEEEEESLSAFESTKIEDLMNKIQDETIATGTTIITTSNNNNNINSNNNNNNTVNNKNNNNNRILLEEPIVSSSLCAALDFARNNQFFQTGVDDDNEFQDVGAINMMSRMNGKGQTPQIGSHSQSVSLVNISNSNDDLLHINLERFDRHGNPMSIHEKYKELARAFHCRGKGKKRLEKEKRQGK